MNRVLSGDHGFVVTLPNQAPGAHSYDVRAVNLGYPGPSAAIGNSSIAATFR